MCVTQQRHFQFLSSVKYMRPEVYFHTLRTNFRFKFIKYHKKSLHDTQTHMKLRLCYTQSSSPTLQTGRKVKTCNATGHKTTSTRNDNKKTVRNPGTGFQGWNSELIDALSLERPVERKWKGREEV